jgi:hypothetical protein
MKDEKDLRGRWKKGRVSDVYDESSASVDRVSGILSWTAVGDPGPGNDRDPAFGQTHERDQLLALHPQMSALQRSLQDVRAS